MAEARLSYYNSFEVLAQVAAYNVLRLGMSNATIVCKRWKEAQRTGFIEHCTNKLRQFEGLNLAQSAACFDASRKRPTGNIRNTTDGTENQDNNDEERGQEEERSVESNAKCFTRPNSRVQWI
ncbi:hypothetical protein G6F42_012019 [Rhizopus arrhizus]|nr:hypothetical protein G6F42_012019 [Rhizopus arrhizus]